jgi:hypothetical protein
MRFSTTTLMALVAAVGTYASPVAKRQAAAIDDVTILNYACKFYYLTMAVYSFLTFTSRSDP